MTTPSNDPYQLQRLLSRRSFLGLSGLGAAAVLGITLESASANPHGKGLARAAVQAQSADSGPHPPFALDSSCVLSEDHFLVKVGKIDPATDKVVAYTRPDGQVEAVLLQNEIISLVYRDPTTAGGWNSHEIAAGATDMVAGMASDKSMNLHLHVFYRTTSGQVRHLLQGPSSSDGTSSTQFTPVDTLNWSASGPLQITTDVMRNLLVFSFQPSSAPGKTDAHMDYYWTANGFHSFDSFTGTMSGFEFDKSSDQSHACAAVTFNGLNGWVFVFVPDAAHSTVRVYDKTLYNSNHSSGSGSVSSYGAKQPPSLAPASVLSVDHVTTNKYLNVPTAVVRTADQQLYTLTYNANDLGYTTWQQLTLPPGTDHSTPLVWEPSSVAQSSNWSTSGNLLNLFVVVKQTLSVIRQVNQGDAMKDEESPIFNPAVPLQTNVAIAASQARPSDGDELIVVDGDGNLEVLVRSMDGEWTANQIHLPATEAADVSTYRVQLTLSDDWGARMAGKALQVTASAPAVALLDGKGITLSSTPVTFTTDGAGHVTIPIVADGLWAPQLTVSGGGLSAPVTVSPSSPVNDYMTGTVTLNYLPAVTGDTLAGAATPSGTTVFPVAKQDKGAAADAATVLATAAAAGANPTLVGEVAPEARAQGLNGIGAHGVSKQMPSDAVTLGSRTALGVATFKVDGIELSFSDLKNDALYAIKKGAAKVSEAGVNFDSTLKRWVTTISADFDAWGHQVLAVTIEGLQDAAHVFHSVINRLEGVLTDVIDWLKAHVLKLLADTVTLAARYDGWLLQVSDELYTLTQKAQATTDKGESKALAWLQGKEDELRAALTQIETVLVSKTISDFTGPQKFSAKLNAGPQPTPQQPTSANANWLLEKVTQAGPSPTTTPSVDAALDDLIKQTEVKVAAVGQDFIKAANDFRDALASLVSNPKDFGTVGINKVISAIGEVIHAGLDAADGVIDVMLGLVAVAISTFKAILSTPLNDLPLLGPLLKAAGMTTPITIGSLVTLLVSFPTALGYKLAHLDTDALPFKNVNTTLLRTTSAADDLSYATYGATSFWALMDTIAAGIVSDGNDPPAFFSWVDIVAPAVISALTVPAHDGGLPFTSAIKLDDNGDVFNAVAWGVGALPGVFSAISFYVGEKYTQAAADAATESTLFLTSLSGFGGAVFGVVAALSLSSSPPDAALFAVIAVLGNTSAMLAYGLEKAVVASTDGLSALLAGLIGGFCTWVASVIDVVDTLV
jgi:hypothetical protein